MDIALLAALIFLSALLYSSVGHAGASGYLAAMALFSVAPETMKPAALTLNLLVASIASWRYIRAGQFSLSLFWPLALASVPLAFLGGTLMPPDHLYKPIVGAVLLYAAWRFVQPLPDKPLLPRSPPIWLMLIAGAAIGFLSGLTGVGGGIFLSPILVLFAWAPLRQASGVAALFILLNSASGLAGLASQGIVLPEGILWWAVAAVAGALIGTELGSRRLGIPMLRKLLGAVLVIAGLKMVLGV